MICLNCHAENAVGKKFCNACGRPLSAHCPKCKAENPHGAAFCGDCGASLTTNVTTPAQPTTSAPQIRVLSEPTDASIPDGERKTVTAFFADIKGSTELEQDLDPEEARKIIDPALKLMIEAVQRYDGYVVQSTGDGIFALFGAPLANEEHPQRALYAALRLLDEMRRYSVTLREKGNLPLEARVGVNTGEVVVRSITTGQKQAEYTPIGHTTNLASRMQALAPTGSIAISESTRRLVEGYFALKPLGPTKVKGVTEPVNVYEVTGLGPLRTRLQRSQGRGLSKFVGREPQMQALALVADRAKSGSGQLAAAMAEAGTGKSRLFFEFKAKNQSGFMVLETFSVSHGKASAFMPVLDLLQNYFGIIGDDDKRKRREKVTGRVVALDRSLEDELPYLFSLLSIVDGEDPLAQMDGSAKKKHTLDVLKRLLLRESLNQPLMVIFEDLHWIDDETQAFLNLLADSIASAKILLLVNYRPEYSHQWGSRSHYTQLRLEPLGKESAEEMLTALLSDSPQMVQLKRMIIEKTQGNPFFMEETVQVLLDEGALVREGNAVKLTKQFDELKIPPTVQGILASRIDRLPQDEKDLLQTLAVMGKEFPLAIVREVTKKPDDALNRMLADLQLAEFIYEQPAMGDVEYSFKHALTLLVAYNSILTDRRKHLHERIGAAIETLYTTSLNDHWAELAHHYSHSANDQKAITYLRASAAQSTVRSAFEEAIRGLTQAIEILRGMPESVERDRLELGLQMELALPFGTARGYGAEETKTIYARTLELGESLGDTNAIVYAMSRLIGYYTNSGRHPLAKKMAAQLLPLAEKIGDPGLVARARFAVGMSEIISGEFVSALAHFNSCLESATRTGNAALDITFLIAENWRISTLLALGRFEEGWQRANAFFSETERYAQPLALVIGQVAMQSAANDGYYERALSHADLIDELTKNRDYGQFAESAIFNRIATLIGLRRYADAIELNEKSFSKGIDFVAPSLSPYYPATLLCLAQGKIGEPKEALLKLDKMLAEWTQADFKMHLSLAHVVRGELLLMLDPPKRDEAERDFRIAIDVAQQQQAKWPELQACIGLAKLLRDTNRREEAHALLTVIYGWFTSGFDTAEMIEAKALLDELNQEPTDQNS